MMHHAVFCYIYHELGNDGKQFRASRRCWSGPKPDVVGSLSLERLGTKRRNSVAQSLRRVLAHRLTAETARQFETETSCQLAVTFVTRIVKGLVRRRGFPSGRTPFLAERGHRVTICDWDPGVNPGHICDKDCSSPA
jgi:hypothetical protein